MADKVAPYGLTGMITGQRSPAPEKLSADELATAQPVAQQQERLSPDELATSAPANTIQHGAGTAFARGVATGGTFGAASFLSAAIDSAAQKLLPQRALDYLQQSQPSDVAPINQDVPFAQRREQYNAAHKVTKEQHPYAYGAGEVAGAIAVPAPGAGLTTRAVEKAVANRIGARAATTAGKILAKGAGAAAGGAVVGGEFGAGTSLSQGSSAPETVANTALGAALGSATGPAAALTGHAISAAVSKAGQSLANKYTQVFGSEVFGHASKKATQKSWAQILGKEAEQGVEQDAAKKFVASSEMAPVEAAARHGKLDEALGEIDKRLEHYRPGRLQNYAQIEDAAKFEVGKGLDELDTALFRARNASKNPQATQALEKARNEWISDFSSVDAGSLQRELLRPRDGLSGFAKDVFDAAAKKHGAGAAMEQAGLSPVDVYGTGIPTGLADELRAIVDYLPQSGRISRTQIADAVKNTHAGPEAIRYLENHVLDPERGLLSWDPKATIPAVELRAQATTRQQSALQAFDKLNPNQSVETKTAVKKAIVGALEKHLDKAAATSPQARAAVARIRQDDVRFSVLLAAKQGLQEGLEKQQRQEFAPLKFAAALLRGHAGGGIGLAAGGFAAEQGADAVKSAEEGHYLKAIGHGGAALAAGGLAGKALAQKLSILANRAQQSQAAQRLYQAIQARLPHGPIGAVTSSTLNQQQPQPQQ